MAGIDVYTRSWLSSCKISLDLVREYLPDYNFKSLKWETPYNLEGSYRFNFIEISQELDREGEYVEASIEYLREKLNLPFDKSYRYLAYTVFALHPKNFCDNDENKLFLESFMASIFADLKKGGEKDVEGCLRCIDSLLLVIEEAESLLSQENLDILQKIKKVV